MIAKRIRSGLAQHRFPRLSLGVMLAAALACGALLIADARKTPRDLSVASEWIRHTREVMSEADGLLVAAAALESRQRGFLLTQDTADIERFADSTSDVIKHLTALSELTEDNPSQQRRIADLRDAITTKLAELNRTIDLARSGDLATALAIVRQGEGRATTQRVRDIVHSIYAEEERLLAVRRATYAKAEEKLRSGYGSAGMAALLLLVVSAGGAAFAMHKEEQRRRERAADLERWTEAEERRLKEAARVHLALDVGNIGLWEFDLTDGTASYDGRAATILNGTLPPEMKLPFDGPEMRTWAERIHPEDRARRDASMHAFIRGEVDDYAVSYRVQLSEGNWSTLAFYGKVVEQDAADTSPPRLIGIVLDMTPQVSAAARLRAVSGESRQRAALLKAAYGTARIGLCLLDPELRFLEVNEYMAGLHGRPISEHLGQPLEAMGRDLAPAFRPLLQQVLTTGIPIDNAELSITRSGGASGARDWLVSVQPVRDAEGVVGGAGVAVLDITDRKQAEEELRTINEKLEEIVEARSAALVASEARLRAYWQHSPDTLFVVRIDPEGGDIVFEDANPALEAVSGLKPEQIRGRRPGEVFPAEIAATLTANYRRCVEVGELVRYSITLEGAKGPYDAETVLVPLPGSDGRIAQVLGSERDVTERNKLQAQLARAQKLECVGQLTGGVAHDFNNLLTVVLNNAGFLRRKAEAGGDQQAIRQATMIEGAAERGGRLASQLLSFSRKQMLLPETVHPMELLDGLSDLFKRAAGETIRLRITSDYDLWPCRADPTQLESAILNLVINARDAMQPHGGKIVIEATNESVEAEKAASLSVPPGDYVRISVTDTGSGMSPEVLARVFEPFFTTKEIGKGSGLGLPQVHGFAGQSGGGIDIVSEVGRGTTVSIFLPRESEVPKRAAEPGEEQTLRTGVGGGRTVLVVEDEPDLRESVCVSLREIGYRVLEAHDARSAWRQLTSDEPIDLLFTDVVLPGGVSGVELAREARRLRQDLRLMLTSGYSNETLSLHDGATREFELLPKPYKPERLASRMHALMAKAA